MYTISFLFFRKGGAFNISCGGAGSCLAVDTCFSNSRDRTSAFRGSAVSSSADTPGVFADAGKSRGEVLEEARADKGLLKDTVVAGADLGADNGCEEVPDLFAAILPRHLFCPVSPGGCTAFARVLLALDCDVPQLICVILGAMMSSKEVSMSGLIGGRMYCVFVIFPDT